MSYAKKNIKNVTVSIISVFAVAAIAVWQFFLFVTSNGSGTAHLWWAIGMAVLACTAAFLVLSVFVRHDTDDDLHITATRRA